MERCRGRGSAPAARSGAGRRAPVRAPRVGAKPPRCGGAACARAWSCRRQHCRYRAVSGCGHERGRCRHVDLRRAGREPGGAVGGGTWIPGGAAVNVRFEPSQRLRGRIRVPPDKSISHRAAIIGAMASEPVRIRNYLDAADTRSTLAAVQQLGVLVERRPGELVVRGCGLRNAQPPSAHIYVGNAGTLMRLLPGWLAFQQGSSFVLDGDDSIRRRPVDRIAEPLQRMGAGIEASEGRFPPFTVHGATLTGIEYELPVASAQVKSCILLAGLLTDHTTVIEPVPARDP